MIPLDKTRKNFLWLSESKEIDAALFGDVRFRLHKFAHHFDGILTHEQEIIDEYDNAVFVLSKVTTRGLTKSIGVFIQNKNDFLSCFTKSNVYRHRNRHQIVDDCYDHIDLFGGYRDSPRIGKGNFVTSWREKRMLLLTMLFSCD